MKGVWFTCLAASLMTACAIAQPDPSKVEEPTVFSTRVYQMPDFSLEVGFESKTKGRIKAPALPPAKASDADAKAFIKASNEVLREYFSEQGFNLPQGTLACYDPESGTLVARTTGELHEGMKSLEEACRQHAAKVVGWSLEILEAPTTSVLAALKNAGGNPDHQAEHHELLAKGRVDVVLRGETKSGEKIIAHHGGEAVTVSGSEPDASASGDEFPLGTQFEFQPVIGPDGHIVDIGFILSHQYAPLVPRWEALNQDKGKEKRLVFDKPVATLKSSYCIRAPAIRLLGVWSLEGVKEPERAGNMQAAFLRTTVVPVLPLENKRVSELMAKHGEAVLPAPKRSDPFRKRDLPDAMTSRAFRVTPDFFSLENFPEPTADPFSQPLTTEEAGSKIKRRKTAKEILMDMGVSFPEGSAAVFNVATGHLVVRNTFENLEAVGFLLEEMGGCMPPKNVNCTLHVVQGSADFILKLQRETLAVSDHADAWKNVEDALFQGKAKVVRAAWFETRSGESAETQQVIEYRTGRQVKWREPNKTSGAPAEKPEWEKIPVGLVLYAEPVVGPDGKTIDLNLKASYDDAMPSIKFSEGVEEKSKANWIETRRSHFSLATTMLNGFTRLLAIWKPYDTKEEGKEVLQAAFLRVQTVYMDQR